MSSALIEVAFCEKFRSRDLFFFFHYNQLLMFKRLTRLPIVSRRFIMSNNLVSNTRKLSIDNSEAAAENIAKKLKPLDENKLNTLQFIQSTAPKKVFKPLVWIDCEMTGLDIKNDNIIEICCIITDGNLKIIDETGYESTVYVTKEKLDSMNEWCVNQHGKSGLTAKILANPDRTLDKVQVELLDYIKSHIDEPNKALLAGNSVHMDKFFMMKEFPKVIDYLHYRLIDVSSIMEVGWRHNPELMKLFPKKVGTHTAKSDILESINQLKWYWDHYLKSEKDSAAFIQSEKAKLEAHAPEAVQKTVESTVEVSLSNAAATIEPSTEK